MTSHLASFALMGSARRRIGTRFVFKFEDIHDALAKPYFKWRNDECYARYQHWLASRKTAAKPA